MQVSNKVSLKKRHLKIMHKIKPLPELPTQIKEASENDKLAIFIGAGMSRFTGCSGWNELANDLLKKCESDGLINNYEKTVLEQSNDYKKTITICNNLLKNDDRFIDVMKSSLNDSNVGGEEIDLGSYKNLFSLNGLFITTNADRHIDKLFTPDNIVIDNFNSFTKINKNYLYKIHGSIVKKESLIFTVNGYLQRYTDAEYGKFLEQIFGQYTVLFVGYGLGEFELLDYLFKTISRTSERHFFLKDYFNHEKRFYEFDQKYFDELKIELIPYSKDEIGFNQLPKILKKWADDIKTVSDVMIKTFDEIDDALENPDE